ncbi:hypothetical protein SAY86_014521 [Trapa natans]|uniref:VOC domain-containing protein n=1 Tax=Trapa natans TaxID=22666 RepID=A0AAN7L0U2_TRANT|nr:hypothetical protein SAY86_014521 [Trapa natans]
MRTHKLQSKLRNLSPHDSESASQKLHPELLTPQDLDQCGVTAKELELLHRVGMEGHHGIVIVDSLINHEAVGGLLALKNRCAKVLGPLPAQRRTRTAKKRTRSAPLNHPMRQKARSESSKYSLLAEKQKMRESSQNPLNIKSLNHVSLVCRSVEESMDFYQNVLGFIPIRRPNSLDFEGAWMFGYGIGIHLLQIEEPEKMRSKKTKIDPKDSHISFQCESMGAVKKKLTDMEIEYVRSMVEEGGIHVDQLFFHDPDGFMIEICNCDSLPVVPLAGEVARMCSRVNLPSSGHQPHHLRQHRQSRSRSRSSGSDHDVVTPVFGRSEIS